MSGDATRWFDERREDWKRHVLDLQERGYEGALERSQKEAVFRHAFELTTPVAERVLRTLDEAYLDGRGTVTTRIPVTVPPEELLGADREPRGGLLGSWQLTWPELERARSRFDGRAFPPVEITAIFPSDFTHPHLALCDLSQPRQWGPCWPLQVSSTDDAERQAGVLAAIAEADMHERTFASDLNWRLLHTADAKGVRHAE